MTPTKTVNVPGFKWSKRSGKLAANSCFDDDSDEEPMDIVEAAIAVEKSLPKKKVHHFSAITDSEYQTALDQIAETCAQGVWDEALAKIESLLLKKCDEKVLEMKAQILMELDRNYDAIKSCEYALNINPLWWQGHQTHGRALLAFGEPELALKAFQKAFRINPSEDELRLELRWVLRNAHGMAVPENAEPRNLVQLRKTSCIILPLYNW